uniref:Uncharacterized protein n=1 Tax=Oryza sativa subsp. japonica TaxID=39947 RepID=Q33AM6_ORYSJ|nr:hypothetical protein LOC_Os10g09180 [Oryza sativa Japonica Group]
MSNTAKSEITSHAHVHAYGSPYTVSSSYNSASCDVNDYGRISENSASKHLPPYNSTTYSLSPAQPQSFGIEHIPLPKPSVNNFQQNGSFVQSTTHKAEDTHRTNDTKLASSVGGQFVDDFSSKIDNLIEEIYRDVEEKMNAYILSKGSKPIFNQQWKLINLDLSANEKEVAMLDFSGNIGPFVLPAEFRAKEDDEHLDDGARNHDDKVKILESHQRTNLDIAQVKKLECFSNKSDQSYAKDDRFDKRNRSRWSSRKSSAQAEGSSTRKQIWVPKSRGQEKSLAAGAHVSVQNASVQKKAIEPGGHARIQQLGNVHHMNMKREASSAELVTSQNPPKSSGGNGSQLRHSHGLSNWRKKQLHKLSAEKLRERGMAWVLKASVQVQNETDVKVGVGAKNEKGVKRCAPNQRFASNHQVLSPPYYTYSSPMPPIPMSWNQFSETEIFRC